MRVCRIFTIIKKGIITTNENNKNARFNTRLTVPAPALDIDFNFAYNIKEAG
jgi:hypothetical protein